MRWNHVHYAILPKTIRFNKIQSGHYHVSTKVILRKYKKTGERTQKNSEANGHSVMKCCQFHSVHQHQEEEYPVKPGVCHQTAKKRYAIDRVHINSKPGSSWLSGGYLLCSVMTRKLVIIILTSILMLIKTVLLLYLLAERILYKIHKAMCVIFFISRQLSTYTRLET